MSMTSEELEKTGILRVALDKADEDELTINEQLEEFEDKIEYLDIDEKKKNKLRKLIGEIKDESDEKVKEFLFNQLVKLVDNNEE